jgi:CHAT domain-containing protein/tetratricopeptide (TPR) repeat protein
MFQSSLFARRILTVPLLTALVISTVLAASTAWAKDQLRGTAPAPRLSDAERARHLQDRDEMRAEVMKLAQAGKQDEAVAAAVKELALTRKVRGELHEDVVDSLKFLSRLHVARDDWAAARKALTDVLAIRQRQPDQKDWRIADARQELAHLGSLQRLNPAQRQRRQEADRLGRLAVGLMSQGKHAEGISPCRGTMEIRGELLGKDSPGYATSLANLAEIYRAMGDYARAEPLYRQALEIDKRALGEVHPLYATILNNLALLYHGIGDYAQAVPLLRNALEIRKRALGESHPDYANSLNNLAALYLAKEDYAKATPLCRQAVEIAENALGVNHANYAGTLLNLAALYRDTGDYAKAEPLFRQALEIRKRALGENHPAYASSLNNLGLLYKEIGDYAQAEPLFRQALEIRKRALGENHPDHANSLISLGSLYLSQGHLTAAEQSLRQGLTLLTRWAQGGLTGLGERQRIRLLAAQRGALNAYLSVAPAAGIKVEELYRHVLAWKGVVEVRQEEDGLARDDPELKDTLSKLKHARASLAHLAFATPRAGQGQAWLRQLEALRDRKEELESDLARKSGVFRQLQASRRLDGADVAAALPEGRVLVDLFYYLHHSPPQGGKGRLRIEERILAFVLRRRQLPVIVPLGASRTIDQFVRSWRYALGAGSRIPMAAAALELSRRIWEPLKPHLEGATSVVVAPDGALTYFPLAALPGHRPNTYLIEDLAIAHVSSAHGLVDSLAAAGEAKLISPEAGPSGLLAIGGIDYQADPGGAVPTELAPTAGVLLAESQRAGFGALAGTGPEVQRIGEIFGKIFPQEHAVLLRGAAPTEGALKQQLGQHWRYLHLATHGFFESPARVAALRAGLKSDDFGLAGFGSSEESASLALAPLLHSGVALAGAARRTDDTGAAAGSSLPDRDDGILTAEEVQALDLRGTELVVLSACETGLGKLEYGQGVMGLQRAFQAAGARAVIASLWKVDDAATTVLMEQFYTNLWSKRMPKLEALRHAQLTVLDNPGLVKARRTELAKQRGIDDKPEKLPDGGLVAPTATRSDPALWAAFVLSGDVR